MPHVSITLYPGKKPEQLKAIAEAVRKSMCDTVGWKENDISVSIQEKGPDDFAGAVQEKLKGEKLVLTSDYIH